MTTPDTHALLVALITTHRQTTGPYGPGDRKPTGAGPSRPVCTAGDWTDQGHGHTHAHHLADVLLEHGIELPTPSGFIEHAQAGAPPLDRRTRAARLADWLDRDDVAENRAADEIRNRADEINRLLDHPTPTPPAKYGRCPWCSRPVDSIELLEAGPYLTPCWHLVGVIVDDDPRVGLRLERAAPADQPGRS